MPTVMVLSDVHPQNFGVMPDKTGAPILGVSHFGGTLYASFTWDFKREKWRRIIKAFIEHYLEAMANKAENGTEKNNADRMDDSPKAVR